ncbi:MAG: hypothetical protein JKY43_07025 [Phycisphaerales bacterium]|nr:hypothetical protein [Phycisphaerales bacterium]
MKLKGVNPIAQHIEKAVLGLTVVIFLGVISMQFVTEPNKVKINSSRSVSPDQIYNELESKANALQSQISDLTPALPDVEPVNLLQRYNKAFEANSGDTAHLTSALGSGIDVASQLHIVITAGRGTDVGPIESMYVPATSTPIASSTWGTLDPYAILQVPEYEEFVPAAQPFDFPSVSIEVDFSGTTLRDILQGTEEYPGVPRLFWVSTGMAVMGLDVQRQALQNDGSWSSSESISTPPGTPLPTNAVNKNDGLVRLNTIIASAQEVASQVMRPMFPPTISGPLWQPPSDSLDSESSTLTEIQKAQRQLARLTAEVNRLKNPTRSTSSSTRSTGTRASSSQRGSRSSSSSSSSGGRSTGKSNINDQKIEHLESQIETVQAALERLGVESDLAIAASSDILDQEFIQLWAHDLGVTAGDTYRYRTRIVLNNPYFRKGPYLDETNEAQQALTIEPFANGQWSQWSEPVAVGSKEFFFVTEASKPVIGEQLPQARIELYSMYYGYYRRTSLSLAPGQPLLGEMRISSDLFLMDTDAIKSNDVAGYIQSINEDRRSRQNNTELPQGLSSAPSRLSINLDSYMIEIANDPLSQSNAQGSQDLRLLFRLADGSIDSRIPAIERGSRLYKQAQSSATMASRARLRPTGQPAKSEAADLFISIDP